MNTILESNLSSALYFAVRTLAAQELADYGPNFKSAFRAGLEENIRKFEEGEEFKIIK